MRDGVDFYGHHRLGHQDFKPSKLHAGLAAPRKNNPHRERVWFEILVLTPQDSDPGASAALAPTEVPAIDEAGHQPGGLGSLSGGVCSGALQPNKSTAPPIRCILFIRHIPPTAHTSTHLP